MAQCWCLKCSLAFPDLQSRNHHFWFSEAHIFCKACVRHIGGLTVVLDEFDSEFALQDHWQMEHFGCTCCFNCEDDHYGCLSCSDDCVFRTDQKGYERRYYQNNFTDKGRDNTSEDFSSSCEDDTGYHCLQCPHIMVFENAEDLDRHLRTRHGLVYCPYISKRTQSGSCIGPPQVCWHSQERGHMEGCYHPNPCNDFDAVEAGQCNLCRSAFQEPADVLEHYYAIHPCSECASYISTYYNIQSNHFDECHQDKTPSPSPTPPPTPPLSPLSPVEQRPVNIYAILGIHPQSTYEEARRAAKQRRVDTHPDKLKRACRSEAERNEIDEMAKLVGFAADIVLDPTKRLAYDEAMREWRFE